MNLNRLMNTHRFLTNLLATLTTGLIVFALTIPVSGHGVFKKTLEKKYKEEGLRVTCNMCHVKGAPKTERNTVGQMFYKEFEDEELSSRWESVEGDERKTLEKDVMVPAFLKALEEVYAREAAGKTDSTFASQIPAGEVEGSKLRKKK